MFPQMNYSMEHDNKFRKQRNICRTKHKIKKTQNASKHNHFLLYFITFYILHTDEKNSVLQVFSTHFHISPFWKCPLQGVAEAELEEDLERTFKILFFSSAEEVSPDKLHKSATWHSWPTVYTIYFDLPFHRRSALLSAQQESALEVRRAKCRFWKVSTCVEK